MRWQSITICVVSLHGHFAIDGDPAAFFDDLEVMLQVAGGDPGEGAERDFFGVDEAGIVPAIGIDAPQQHHVGLP